VEVSAERRSTEYKSWLKKIKNCYSENGMNTLTTELQAAKAQSVVVTEDSLMVDLVDGRTISAPLGWYPRLLHGTSEERNKWRLIGAGEGIHWPDLDEDISVENLLAGKPSGESQRSFKHWLDEYATRNKQPETYETQEAETVA
jgi:hypothetical protein